MKPSRLASLWKRGVFALAAALLLYAWFLYMSQATEERGIFHGRGFGEFRRAYGEYLEEHNWQLPPMNSTPAFIAAIAHERLYSSLPAAEIEARFVEQKSGKPHHINGWLHGKSLRDLPESAHIVAFYDDAFDNTVGTTFQKAFHLPNSNPRSFERAIMYADGHSTFINEKEWPAIKKRSHIP